MRTIKYNPEGDTLRTFPFGQTELLPRPAVPIEIRHKSSIFSLVTNRLSSFIGWLNEDLFPGSESAMPPKVRKLREKGKQIY